MSPGEEIWNKDGKDGLAKFRAGLSLSRRDDDARKLAKIFDEAAQSPLLKQALDWAKENEIEFIIDRNLAAGGLYHAGTGVLAISEQMARPENRSGAIAALVREIRHAWQDWNWFLPSVSAKAQLTETYMRKSILEADADAYGTLALKQWELSRQIERLLSRKAAGNDVGAGEIDTLKEKLAATEENVPAQLWEGFKGWFNSHKPVEFGILLVQKSAKHLGLDTLLDAVTRNRPLSEVVQVPEFDPSAVQAKIEPFSGIPIKEAKNLQPLGAGFSGGGNYMGLAPAGYIEKNVLSPKLAEAFYAINEPRHELVDAIIRAETRPPRSRSTTRLRNYF